MKAKLTGTAVFTRARLGNRARALLFSDIWYHYYPRLSVFVGHFLTHPDDIDDAVQEAMLKVYRYLDRYRPDRAFSTWIYSIARNHCLDQLRREAVKKRYTTGNIKDEFVSPYPTPEGMVLQSDMAKTARALIGSLSPENRQIAFLRFFEEMPYSHISKILGIPVGTLKYRIHQMREKLRERRADYCA